MPAIERGGKVRTVPADMPLPLWGDRRRRRVGLLGGSFNPAHEGHRHISLEALAALGLDEVWWLVSPQNPLKPRAGMASLAERLSGARGMAAHARVRVTDVEDRLGTTQTADTLKALRRRFPLIDFVWLMGSDNLGQIRYWYRWMDIFHTTPVAILDRGPYSMRALAGLAARRFAAHRVPAIGAPTLAGREPPAWVFLPIRRHGASATEIRARRAIPAPGHPAGAANQGSRP